MKKLSPLISVPLIIVGLAIIAALYVRTHPALLEEQFNNAIMKGDTGRMKMLLAWGASPNWINKTRPWSPLQLAINRKDIDQVKILLDHGANVNAKTIIDFVPLSRAVIKADKNMCALLISRGADVNATNSSGDSPLFFAIRDDHEDICDLLISKGADVNIKDKHGYTPLKLSKMLKRENITKLLVAHGAKE